jgi:hypothetical protein
MSQSCGFAVSWFVFLRLLLLARLKVRTQTSRQFYAPIANETKRPVFIIFIFHWCSVTSSRCDQTTHRHPRNAPNIPYGTFIIIDNDNGTTSILLPFCEWSKIRLKTTQPS